MAVRKFADATGITELWSKVKSYISGVLPTKTSDLTNDSGYITGMEILSYGISSWDDFTDAYNAKKVVYCRASSNSNPASGSQTRLAFMAYVNNAATPTEVEFQYYRSINSHTVSQQGDQVFVYKLTSANKWTVITREAASKVAAGGDLTRSYSNGTVTISGTIPTVPTNVSAFTNDAGYITGYTETDPVFSASAAAGIQSTDITKWNKIYNLYKVSSENSGSTYWWKLTVSQNGLYNYTNAPGSDGALGKICIPNGKSGGSTTYINFVSDTNKYNTNLTFNLPNKNGTIALWSDIPTKVSDLTNDAGYLTIETDPTVPSWAKASSKPSYTASEVGAVPTSRTVNGKALSSNITLSASDVSAQETLVSGTNIKTVNSTSLLGSGNVAVQPTLVSGTNIKTVNGNSILGSGDLPIEASSADVTQVSITVANWNATTTCTVSVTGVTTSNSIIVSPAPGSIPDYVASGVYCSAQAAGTLTFECTSTPTADLVVNVMIVG